MKTQINDIKRGNLFISKMKAIREERSKKILAENGDTLRLTYKGVAITLKRFTTGSGYTWYGGTTLSHEQISTLFPDDAKHNNEPELVAYKFCLNNELAAYVTRYRRNNVQEKWGHGLCNRLSNRDIVIL